MAAGALRIPRAIESSIASVCEGSNQSRLADVHTGQTWRCRDLTRPSPVGRASMAKGQKRSGREAKKPKKEKPKPAAGSPFSNAHSSKSAAPVPESKK